MSKSERRNRTKLIQVRCTQEEHDMIMESADASGLTVAEYIRRIALRRRIVPRTDHKLIMELMRLGGLQKHLFNEGHGMHSKEYAEILQAIKIAILKVDSASE